MKANRTRRTFIANLNAGVSPTDWAAPYPMVAAGVLEHGKKGKVVYPLDYRPDRRSHQVEINHKLDFFTPTKRGRQG